MDFILYSINILAFITLFILQKKFVNFNVRVIIVFALGIFLAYINTITVGAIYAVWSYISEANSQIFSIISAIRQIPIRFAELEK